MPSAGMKRAMRTRSSSLPSNTVVVLRTPSETLLAKSSTPTTGLVAAPMTPFPTPLKKPRAPSCSAPSQGFLARPPTPEATDVKNELAPAVTPYSACLGGVGGGGGGGGGGG